MCTCETVEEGIDKLRALFPDTTLLAALDLVDRESGMCLLHSTRLRLTSSVYSAQVPDAVGEMPLRSPWVHRDVQRLPPSGLVTAHVLLLHLPCFRIRGPDERVSSDGKPVYYNALYAASWPNSVVSVSMYSLSVSQSNSRSASNVESTTTISLRGSRPTFNSRNGVSRRYKYQTKCAFEPECSTIINKYSITYLTLDRARNALRWGMASQ